MRPIDTDEVASSVGRSVCRDREPCKNGWTDRDAVWGILKNVQDGLQGEPKNGATLIFFK